MNNLPSILTKYKLDQILRSKQYYSIFICFFSLSVVWSFFRLSGFPFIQCSVFGLWYQLKIELTKEFSTKIALILSSGTKRKKHVNPNKVYFN